MKKGAVIQWLCLVGVGAGIPFFVLWRNVFPHISLDYLQMNEFGHGLVQQEIAGRKYLVATPGLQYPYNRTEVDLVFSEKVSQEKIGKLNLAKDYLVNTYPLSEPITRVDDFERLAYQDNPEKVPNGAVYSQADSVIIVSRGRYHPIVSPSVFEAMGYRWDTIVPIDPGAYAELEAGEKIKQNSPHPDGTVLRTGDGEYFFVWEGKKIPIDKKLIGETGLGYQAVDISGSSVKPLADCQPEYGGKEASCLFVYDEKMMAGPGKVFLVYFDEWPSGYLASGNVTFATEVTFDKEYLRFSFGQIKAKLYARYAEYFL